MAILRPSAPRLLSAAVVLVLVAGCAGPPPDGSAEDAAPEPVRLTVSGDRNGQGAWSPDGRRIAFVSNRSGTWQVWTIDADGGNPRRVTDSADPVGWPTWNAAGTRIYFYAGSGEHYRLLSVRPDGADVQPVLASRHSDFRPTESPDGGFLLFDRWGATEPKNHDLYIADLSTGAARQLTHHEGYDSDARWSPDGRRVLFQSDRDGSEPYDMQVYLVGADGSGVRRLTDGPDKHLYPTWCPDGDLIAFVKEREGRRELWTLRLSTGQAAALVACEGNVDSPAWSPDGAVLLFASQCLGEGTELARMATPACAEGRASR